MKTLQKYYFRFPIFITTTLILAGYARDGRVLGPVNEMMTVHPFPSTDPESLNWKEHVSDISASEWGWTATKPMVYDDPDTTDVKQREDLLETPLLRTLWYRPFFVLESGTVRHEKKYVNEEK